MTLKNFVLSLSIAALGSVSIAQAEGTFKVNTPGELRVLANPIYPPMEYMNAETGKMDGFDVDLANAIADKLGLKAVFIETAFVDLQAGLQTGRGDVIISGMSDTVQRQDSMDLVDYLVSGPVLFTLKKDADKYKATSDLCGFKIAGSRSTTFPKNVSDWSEKNCVGAGKPAMQVEGVADSNAARLGMKQGRYDAVVQGSETLGWLMNLEPDTYETVGDPIMTNDIFGMGFKKDNQPLRDSMIAALNDLIKDGTYTKLLEKWGLEKNAIKTVEINGAKN